METQVLGDDPLGKAFTLELGLKISRRLVVGLIRRRITLHERVLINIRVTNFLGFVVQHIG